MALKKDSISATIKLELAPWSAPNFARRIGDEPNAEAISVRELDDDALEDMALAWLDDLYRKAVRRSPFYKSAKVGT